MAHLSEYRAVDPLSILLPEYFLLIHQPRPGPDDIKAHVKELLSQLNPEQRKLLVARAVHMQAFTNEIIAAEKLNVGK